MDPSSNHPRSWDDLVGEASGLPPDAREFVSRVVHELKTPLSVIHGYARTILEADLPESDRRWLLETIAEQSHKLAAMLDQLARRYEEAQPEDDPSP